MPIITISPPLCALVAAPTSHSHWLFLARNVFLLPLPPPHSHWLVLVRTRIPQCLGAAVLLLSPCVAQHNRKQLTTGGCSSRSLSLWLHGLVAGLVVEHSVRWAGLSVGPSAHLGLSRSDPGSAVVQQMCHLRFRGVDFLPPGDSVETIGFS